MRAFAYYVWANLNLHHAIVGSIAIAGWELARAVLRSILRRL